MLTNEKRAVPELSVYFLSKLLGSFRFIINVTIICKMVEKFFEVFGISMIKRRKSKVPFTDRWGTPHVICKWSKLFPFT